MLFQGITPDKGMCIADPVEVKVFRDFFIQLELPYKAVRMEQFDVKATIFNYGTEGEVKTVRLLNISVDIVLCFIIYELRRL